MSTVSVLPAASLTVTVDSAALALTVSGAPSICPSEASISNPDGNPVALYSSMPVPPEGLIRAIAVPTLRDAGAVYVGAVGAVRSTVSARVTSLASV